MKNNNILFADYGFLPLNENLDSKDILFNVYKGVIKKIKIDAHFYADMNGKVGTADDVDSCGIIANPEVYDKWERQPLLCMMVELNRGFVWGEEHEVYYRYESNRILAIGGFDLEVMFNQLVDWMHSVRFEKEDYQDDWTDIVYDYQQQVYGDKAIITKTNRLLIANQFYGRELHKDTTKTHYPIRILNNPLEVIPTIEYNC